MTKTWWAIALASLIVISAIMVTLNDPPPRDIIESFPNTPEEIPSPLNYVGKEACSTCHATHNQLWSGSHHDLAMQVANADTVLGNFNNTIFTNFSVTSRFYTQGDNFFVQTDGPDGTLTDYKISYTFGVTPLQQYLIEFPGGRYQALGIAWDTRPQKEGGQRWFHLYPDEKIAHDDELHWTGPNQNWNYMCAECHSTNLRKNYDLADNTYTTTWTDINVACEACHGPGSRHVAWAEKTHQQDKKTQANQKGLQIQFPPFSDKAWQFTAGAQTAKLTVPAVAHTEIEACARCHSRRSNITDVFEHGKPLLDTHLVSLLEQGLYHPDGQILDEVYVYGSFLQSKMYQAGVTCSDCHEPHNITLRETGNALCTRCHRSDHFDSQTHHFHSTGSEGAQCVACHMPSKTYMVVDPRRDHSIRVPRPDLSSTLGTPNACNQCHEKQSTQWAADYVRKWYGPQKQRAPHYGEIFKAGHAGDQNADLALIKLAEETTNSGIVRASALSLLRGYPSHKMAEALQTGMKDKDPLVRIGALRALDAIDPRQRFEMGNHLLKDSIRAVRTEAGRQLAPVTHNTLTSSQQTDLHQAIDEYIQSQLVNAERPGSHLNLGILHTEREKFLQAEEAYTTALRLDPGFYPALVNLADLYRMQKRDKEGEPLLRQALTLAPDDASVHHALGLLLIRTGQKSEAMPALKRAWELQSDNPRYGYVYGVALHSFGEREQAIVVLEDASHHHPNDHQILFTLITLYRDQGNRKMAIQYAKRLRSLSPQDPVVQQLFQQVQGTGAR